MIIITLLIIALLGLSFVVYRYTSLKNGVAELNKSVKQATLTTPTITSSNEQLTTVAQNFNQLTTDFLKQKEELIKQKEQLVAEKQQQARDSQAELTALGTAITYLAQDMRASINQAQQNLPFIEQDHYAKNIHSALEQNEKQLADLTLYQQTATKTVHPVSQALNLTKLLKDTLVTYYEELQNQKFRLALQTTSNVVIQNDPTLVQRILTESLDNMLLHGKQEVRVNLTKEGQFAQLTIQNQELQPIQAPEELTHPFYVEHSVSAKHSQGLGLYFIAELVTATAGTFTYQSNDPVFSITIRWPLAVNA